MQSFAEMQHCEPSTENTLLVQLLAVSVDTKLMLLAPEEH